ncbi:MAG: cytochrome b/b6 domain-containing protein [Betaproteobacteria bacterium]|nr:cytochrome b/b6 domain-containing protein [Betaproteobacteria bacterium]
MRVSGLATWALACVIFLAGAPVVGAAGGESAAAANGKAAEQAAPKFANDTCLACHGNEGFAAPGANGQMRQLHVVKERFEKSVHGKRLCVECHQDITEIPHQKGVERKVGCVKCHQDLWKAAEEENKTQQFARLGVVVQQIDRYMKSIHARPSMEDQSRTNATCYNCHNAHYVYPKGSPGRVEWRLGIPNICGRCHGKERDEYVTSVHGKEVMEKHNPKAAVCSDCHTTHEIDDPKLDPMRLVITRNCGNCHEENFKTYTATYHGQVSTLGYAYTAKCFDCHGNHAVQRVKDPKSTVHPDNRLGTCQKCHANATRGFITFEPHANTHDYDRYPYMWITSKFMIALLGGVFAFFWTHAALWFYREYRDRREHKERPHVLTNELPPQARNKYYQRFAPGWRIAHLVLILSVMTLVLTGMSVFYANSPWAPVVMKQLGSPKVAAVLHRTAAAVFLVLFFGHLIYLASRLGRTWKPSDWFGPDSLVPNWRDFTDLATMFRWFFGAGPRPVFDRWTYWEKFDYWAVFWGIAIIGGSGLTLWFKSAAASVFPGWVFNVATILHGEEAVLAAVFLFTVHFFNNHFRPDKFPVDIVMFTGAMPLEEFRREHALEYQRLVESGELAKHLVDVPSRPMTRGSIILGGALIVIGLTLLVLVLIGFTGSLAAA